MIGSMDVTPERSPWICHICDFTSETTKSRTCERCYRVTCPAHLQKVSVYNEQTGLYVLEDVCVACRIQ